MHGGAPLDNDVVSIVPGVDVSGTCRPDESLFSHELRVKQRISFLLAESFSRIQYIDMHLYT